MNSQKLNKKWTFLAMLLVLLMAASLFVVFMYRKYKAEEPARTLKYYSQVVNENCNSNFHIVDITFGEDCFWGFQDVTYELKCKLDDADEVTETYLLQTGWQCSTFPEAFIEEDVLGRTAFTKEMYNTNLRQQSYWKYIDREAKRHGKRIFTEQAIYKSSDYAVALYVPSVNVLYYLQENI